MSSSGQQITCKVEHGCSLISFYVSMVYGCNRAVDRKVLWDELRVLHGTIAAEAWTLVGDFNSVRSVNEKSDMDSFDMSATAEFNACVREVEIDNLTAKGLFFTWSGKGRGMGYRKSKIDRAMIKYKWQDWFPESEVLLTAPGVLAYFPIVVTILSNVARRRKPIKFFDFWMNHPTFTILLGESWALEVRGHPML